MKKILINIVLILLSFCLKAQTYPLIQNIASGSTKLTIPNYGALYGGMIPLSFSDTSAANTALTYGKNYAGFLIFTTTERSLWYRDITGNRWVMVLPSGSPLSPSAWVYNGNNLASYPDSAVLGTTSNTDWFLISNNQKFLKLNKGGIQANSGSVVNLGVNMSTGDLSFGSTGGSGTVTSVGLSVPSVGSPFLGVSGSPVTTSGTLALSALGTNSQIVLGNGALSSSLPSGLIPTLQQTLTAGSTLNQDNTVDGGAHDFVWNNNNVFQLYTNASTNQGFLAMSSGSTASVSIGANSLSGPNTSNINFNKDLISIQPYLGALTIDTLNNETFQNTLLGWTTTSGANRGKLGYITLGTGLSLSSGVLNTSGTVATPISSLTAATATNGINNLNYFQNWTWNTLSGDALEISTNATTAAGGAQRLLVLTMSGANANASQLTTAFSVSNSHTGTSSTNLAATFSATGGSNNYAIIVPASSGTVGIGNSTPVALLTLGTAGATLGSMSVAGNTSGVITLNPQAAAGTYNWNWPTTAGTSGYFLTSGGGGSTAMTWTQNNFLTGLTVGTTTIASGTTTRILYDNAGVLGEYTLTGTGTVVAMGTSPDILTSLTTSSTTFALVNTNATTLTFAGAATTLTVGGTPTTAITHNYSTNATAAATTKTINLGTGGAASSTTNINIGSANGGTTTVNSPTLAATIFNATTGFRIGGAATSRKILVGNGTNFVQSTETWAVPGTSGNILLSDGTNWTSSATSALTGLPYIATGGTSTATGGIIIATTNNTFDIDGTGAISIGDVSGSGNITKWLLDDGSSTQTWFANTLFKFRTGTVQMDAYGAGAATFDASGNISSVSDIRLKNLQGYYSGGLAELMKVNPIIYKWKPSSGMETKHDYIGFSAQNIKYALGNDAIGTNKQGFLSIQDRAIMATMINAIKEMQAEINDLKQQLKNK